MKIIIRPFNPLSDSSLIYSSSYNQVKYSHFHPEVDSDDFFTQFQKYIAALLASAQIFIACSSDDPNTILGYSIINNSILEFVYVKIAFRRQGLATLLTKNKDISAFNRNNLTQVAIAIIDNHPNLLKQPEESKKEEESNGFIKPATLEVN